MKTISTVILCMYVFFGLLAQHNPGTSCIACHSEFKLGGTIFTDGDATQVMPGESFTLIAPDGSQTVLNGSDANGNIHETFVGEGDYLIEVGHIKSRTWHNIPAQSDCNSCHMTGGNGSDSRDLLLPLYHTQMTPGNQCNDCHHFPATMDYDRLGTESVLHMASLVPEIPGSQVKIGNQNYPFDPEEHTIETVRPDIFAPGYYSMFDVILAVAAQNQIPIEYSYDSTRKTHFITNMAGLSGEYWYHFSYDAGGGNSNEIQFRRENRWDETLWRPGVWIQVVDNESLDDIKAEYLEEIERETQNGHLIPQVKIRLNPSMFEGNPVGSGRITVNKLFENVVVTPHNYRSTGFESPYSKPFNPGVVTSLDILLSLVDQGYLTVVTGVFYTNFGTKYIDSYYVVEMGFPAEGIAHSSGRHGFTYTTGNGSEFYLAHSADNKFHITSDIAVLHAPDFSSWKWTELGNPYYENEITSLNQSVLEDYYAQDRGFNLHAPYPNPALDGKIQISYNVFEPGMVVLDILDTKGSILDHIFIGQVDDLGIHQLDWNLNRLHSGLYYLRMRYNTHQQIRRFVITE